MKSFKCIIIEGPDGAGKTTLIEKLSKHFEAKGSAVSVHAHGPYLGSKEITHQYLRSLEMASEGSDTSVVIMDRAWYSEPIYGNRMRGGSRISAADLAYLEFKAAPLPTLVICCLAPVDDCVTAYKARRELEYLPNEELLRAVHQDYHDWFTRFYKLPKLLYNYKSDPNSTGLVEAIV